MTVSEAVFCGIIQGLAEFLPISSSGHLALAHSFFGASEGSLLFDLMLHLATLIVVFLFYHKELFPLVPAFFTMTSKAFRGVRLPFWSDTEREVLFLILATIPLGGAVLFEDRVEVLALYPEAVGVLLIVNGAVLILADCMARRREKQGLSPVGAVTMGLFQLAAVFPGLSRSGMTISGGLLSGLSREKAVRFSFFMSVPAILGASLLKLPDVMALSLSGEETGYYLLGMGAALLSGLCAMKLLTFISKRKTFGFFAYYCMAVGLSVLLFA